MGKLKVILYTVITGGYDPIPKIIPEEGVEYWLFTDNPALKTPSFWYKSILSNHLCLTPRRLSRLPKLRPHFYLPPHDISIYFDANLVLKKPLRQFAISCVRELPMALHPHPKTVCLYAEGNKCIRAALDDERVISKQLERYNLAGFPVNYGLAENNFIVRKNVDSIIRFNDLWSLEYYSGSQRDQVSFMYCAWSLGMHPYWIWQNARKNDYFTKKDHSIQERTVAEIIKQIETDAIRQLEPASTIGALISKLTGRSKILLVNPDSVELIGQFVGEQVCALRIVNAKFSPNEEPKDVLSNLQRCYPEIMNEETLATIVSDLNNQSFDLVYVNTVGGYEETLQSLKDCRKKVKPGGTIAGNNHNNKNQHVVRAVFELLGSPGTVFEDGTWAFKIPGDTFAIVSFCTLKYLDAFEFVVDSWLQNAGANEVVVFTDSAEFEKAAKPRDRVRFIQAFNNSADDCKMFPWERKIEILQQYFEICLHPFFAYLDCDCWVRDEFKEVFSAMNASQIAGTRLLGRDNRGKGEANAGVIFFRHDHVLKSFFEIWKKRSNLYKKNNPISLYEQDALSHILIEAFDGLHPFGASLVSERKYNCEHDDDDQWLESIKTHQPKIIHFKMKRFRSGELKEAVHRLIDTAKTHAGLC